MKKKRTAWSPEAGSGAQEPSCLSGAGARQGPLSLSAFVEPSHRAGVTEDACASEKPQWLMLHPHRPPPSLSTRSPHAKFRTGTLLVTLRHPLPPSFLPKHKPNITGETSDTASLPVEDALETGPPHLFLAQQEEGEGAQTGLRQEWGSIYSARLELGAQPQ